MKGRYFLIFMVFALILFSSLIYFGCKPEKEPQEATEEVEVTEIAGYAVVPDIEERLAQYSPTEMAYDEGLLSDEQRSVLEKLVMAAKEIDKIFWKQASHRGLKILHDFENTENPSAKDYLEYLKINFGPYDRLDENKPFIGTEPKPLGAGFYPPDMTKDLFEQYVNEHSAMKEQLESTYTIIKRQEGSLVAVPYHEAYQEELENAARYLNEAAELTSEGDFRDYLIQKAEDLVDGGWYKSDSMWIDLTGNLLEIVIGPYETYEDGLMGLKASYESFVFINDFEEMAKLKAYLDYLGEMQKNLPVEPEYKDAKIEGLASPLNVVIEVFNAGDTKAGVQTLAFVLPNEERIREEKGTKKVFLKNVQEAKFNKVLVPISQKILSEADLNYVSFYAYFTETLLHEISHVLGVNYIISRGEAKTTVREALADKYSAIEECKATIVGMHFVPFLIEKGLIPQESERDIYITYLAGMFRSIRFGAHEAHGLATLMELNYHRETGAFGYDSESGKFSVDMEKIKGSITEMAREILILEGDGNYKNAAAFIEKYGKIDAVIQEHLDSLTDIPVDIRPIFKF